MIRHRKSNRRCGAATLELALTLSILFSICYGTIEYGYYFFVKNTMQGAAREGCRAGIVAGATDSSVTASVLSYLQVAGLVNGSASASGGSGSYTIGSYTVAIKDNGATSSVSSASAGDTLGVTITATWGTVGSGFRPMALIGSSKTITAATNMRKEG